MTTIECSSCRKKPLSKDEVGVCKKMLGKGTKSSSVWIALHPIWIPPLKN